MDDTDRKLLFLVCEDPRAPLHVLAKKLGLSRQAVNHRMQNLTNIGVFRSMPASISIHYLSGFNVMVFGRSRATSIEETLDRLGKSESTFHVCVCGGNYLYVIGFLTETHDLNDYVEFVKGAAEMPEPTVGLVSYGDGMNPDWYDGRPKLSYKKLSALDLEIIASLRDDARKPIAKIAESLGASIKTVRRHLDHMRTDGAVDFDLFWDPTVGADMYTVIHVNLRDGADKLKVAKRLYSRDPLHLIYLRSFSNIPDFLLGLINSDKMPEIHKLLGEIRDDEDVLAVTPNLLYSERMYTSFDTKLLREGPRRLSEKVKKHHLQSGNEIVRSR